MKFSQITEAYLPYILQYHYKKYNPGSLQAKLMVDIFTFHGFYKLVFI